MRTTPVLLRSSIRLCAHWHVHARICTFLSTHACQLGAAPSGYRHARMYVHARVRWCEWGIIVPGIFTVDVGDWPDEREYARSDRSDLGSGSNFTSSRLGVSSELREDEGEDRDSIRYEVGTQGYSDQYNTRWSFFPPIGAWLDGDITVFHESTF